MNRIIPNTITTIQYRAFRNKSNLKTVKFVSPVEQIEEKAFENCKSLEQVINLEIPAQCNGCAFCKCINLKQTIICGNALIKVPISTQGKYVVPKGIEIIAKGAFCDCINITDIIISSLFRCVKFF